MKRKTSATSSSPSPPLPPPPSSFESEGDNISQIGTSNRNEGGCSKSEMMQLNRSPSAPTSDDVIRATEPRMETAPVAGVPLLTPHTLRLLKLIEDGSASHARMAVDHLREITATSSPLVLWEILGRLQGFLLSPKWNTRSNAGLAMEGVAQYLPAADQEAFLSQGDRYHLRRADNHSKSETKQDPDAMSLKISNLEGNLSTILKKGQLLVADVESRYQRKEDDDELESLDQSYQGTENFCEIRLEMQRRILIRRLGLSSVLADYTTDCDQLKTQLIDREAIQISRDISSNAKRSKVSDDPKSKKKQKRERKASNQTRLAIGSLLTIEIRQQQQEQRGNRDESLTVSHRNAQSILAGELMFRIFDPSWHIRHGSLIGILALVRAWKAHRRQSNHCDLGIWPHDILARTVCVLALDRFGDYSGASSEAISSGMVAPIREMAGQVFAVVFLMSGRSLRQKVSKILFELFQHDEWETRHGALLAIKYTIVLMLSTKSSDNDEHWDELFTTFFVDQITSGLRDKNDDVQVVAAQILSFNLNYFGSDKRKERDLIPRIVHSLWQSLEKIRAVSSSINELIKLLSKLIRADVSVVLEAIPNSASPINAWVKIFSRLNELLECELISVKVSILGVIGSLSSQIIHIINKEMNQADVIKAKSCLCAAVKDIYILSCETSMALQDDNENNNDASDREILDQSCSETWDILSKVSGPFLCDSETLQNELQYDLLMNYFDLKNIRESSSVLSQGPQMRRATTIASFVSTTSLQKSKGSELKNCAERHSVLEFCLLSHLDSPFMFHCEAACLLIQALFKLNDELIDEGEDFNVIPMLELCQQRLLDKLQTGVMSKLLQNSVYTTQEPTTFETMTNSLNIGYNMVCGQGHSGNSAAATVVELWKEVGLFPEEDSIRKVSVDSMRLSSQIVGTLIAGGIRFLPKKLTPIVRPLMTSLQNETDEKWQMIVSSHMERFLTAIANEPPSSERFEGFHKTFLKVLKNICNLLVASKEPSCTGSSMTIGLLVSSLKEERSLRDLKPAWILLIPLRNSSVDVGVDDKIKALDTLKAVCRFLKQKSSITTNIFDDFIPPLVTLGCAGHLVISEKSSSIIQSMYLVDTSLALEKILPSLIMFLQDDKNDTHRCGACLLLHHILDSTETSMAVCPYVKALLPVVMSMMIDPIKVCAETSAKTFSILVQLAPLVKDSVAISGSEINEEADLVIDHLIHGKKLLPCDIHPDVDEALREGGVVLRQYQHEGVSWLRFLQRINLNGALCDSMGLGKTLQAIVAVSLAHTDNADIKEQAKSLVVCPSSVVGHWVNEIGRYFPRESIFRVFAYMGNSQQRQLLLKNKLQSSNLVVTSYEMLRNDIDSLSKVNWTYCVLDEGHLLRNPKTATAKASRRLRSRHKLILTGTPIQNSVDDVWATFDFLMPSFLGSSSHFSKEFARPIFKGQNLDAAPADIAVGIEKLKLLHQQVLPFILRREKEQVLTELPPKIITRIPCPMSSIQEDLYYRFCSDQKGVQSLSILDGMLESKHQSMGDNPPTFSTDVFKSLLYLRLLCTHPWLVRGGNGSANSQFHRNLYKLEASGKLVALRELLRDAGLAVRELTAADNDTSLIYCDRDEDQTSDVDDHEKILAPDSQEFSRTELRQHQSDSQESRCLVFSQFASSLDIVEELLIKRHMPTVKFLRLDGKVPVSKRAAVVDKFNQDESYKLLLLTTRIGGLGLNLTGADTVIFLEHDWNPHSDLQAMDRAHRIGQKRTVHVYQLVTMNSIEEKTMLLQERKLAMSKAIVNTDNSSMYSMGTDRLLDIFQFRGESSSSSKSSRGASDLENTLDTLVEQYQDEYQSLSLRDFLTGFESTEEQTPSTKSPL